MPLVKLLTSKLLWVRVAALLFTCIAFSTASLRGKEIKLEKLANGCVFSWAFSFSCTLLILLVELFGLQTRAPVIWSNFPITVALYAFLFCLSASCTFLSLNIIESPHQEVLVCRIVSIVFSFLAALAYGVEVGMSRAKSREQKSYMATIPGHVKVFETFIACLIFIILGYLPYYVDSELRWCVAVYCICFIVSMAVVVLCVCESTGSLPVPFSKILFVYELLAAVMYLSAIIIWGLHFNKKRESYFSLFMSKIWNFYSDLPKHLFKNVSEELLIATCVLTGLNFLCYLIDLAYSAKRLVVRA